MKPAIKNAKLWPHALLGVGSLALMALVLALAAVLGLIGLEIAIKGCVALGALAGASYGYSRLSISNSVSDAGLATAQVAAAFALLAWLTYHAGESGGLSGKPLFAPSTRMLAAMHARLNGAVTLVGVGGIASGEDAYAKIRAGASLVQLYSALALQGPGLVLRIKHELLACLERDGFAKLTDAVG